MVYGVLRFFRLLIKYFKDVDGANLHGGYAEILD